jgi:D-glycero-alpha-D-manno-heptose 1-phosphate guanylyltransferase
MKKILAIILAGGLGTRVRHLAPNIPKPLIEVNGKPFIGWIIDYLTKQDVGDIAVSTGYLGEKILHYVKSLGGTVDKIQCFQEKFPLGTGGALVNMINQCDDAENFLVVNGDSIILHDIKKIVENFDTKNEMLIFGTRMNDASRYGTLSCDKEGYLEDFYEKKIGSGLINAGIYYFRKDLLVDFRRDEALSMEKDIIPTLLKNGVKIKVEEIEGEFIDIGTEQSLKISDDFIRKNVSWF